MYAKSLLVISLLAATSLAAPAEKRATKGINPSNDVPITDAERAALAGDGIAKRATKGMNPSNDVAITDGERAGLAGLSPSKRSTLVARDTYEKMQCGHLISGKGGNNGHGIWIPVSEFASQARNFCDAYAGSSIAPNHQSSDIYPTSLTNQKNPGQTGPDGFVVFAVYNQGTQDIWTINSDTCYQALITPLGTHTSKRDADGTEYVQLGRRDTDCWGSKNDDFKGGYTKVNGYLAIGSEVYVAATS